MGWTGMENDGVRRDARAHLMRALEATEDRVLACQRIGDVIYAAYWTAEDKVIGLVVLLDRPMGGWTYYKVIDEGMGPHASDCPISILDVLDETSTEYALEWRARCRANLLEEYRRTVALEEAEA